MSQSSSDYEIDIDSLDFTPKDECERTLWKTVMCFHFWENLWHWIVGQVIALHRNKIPRNRSSLAKLDQSKQSSEINKKQA